MTETLNLIECMLITTSSLHYTAESFCILFQMLQKYEHQKITQNIQDIKAMAPSSGIQTRKRS